MFYVYINYKFILRRTHMFGIFGGGKMIALPPPGKCEQGQVTPLAPARLRHCIRVISKYCNCNSVSKYDLSGQK